MHHTISLRLASALALAVLAAAIAAAQSQGPTPPPQQPPFRTEANFVRVDVYPTKDGKALQGLKAEDFDVLEDGVLQEIKAFEHVVISPAGPQAERRDPSSQREMLQEAANPRTRVFVIFLDMPNVNVSGSHNIAEPLIRLMDRIIGVNDLVGIMTPTMSVSNLILARKTQIIEDGLRNNWTWGTRFSITELDRRERAYEACYPKLPKETNSGKMLSELAGKMVARKRERATLESLQDVVRYVRAIREERKAIITVTEGWVRYRPDPEMMKLREDRAVGYQEPIPGPEAIGVGPTGKLTTKDERDINPEYLTKRECDTDRMRLAQMDNEEFFRDILDDANRANASFYPVDPRGLPAFDAPIGPEAPPPMLVDQANLRDRHESMHDLAVATDGLAVLNNNDLDVGLRRIADDLTSYYLLGYYSSNAKLDGKFRRIQVRVKQPGVHVRARRGYRAATEDEVAAARAAAEPPSGAASAFTAAMGQLARIRPDARFRINVATQVVDGASLIWVAGEVPASSTQADEFALGGTADIDVKAGATTESATVTLKPGQRGFVQALKVSSIDTSRLEVRARLRGEGMTVPLSDAIEASIGPGMARPLLFRRGPSTGNRMLPTADFRFSRTERIRLELPVTSAAKPGAARVLDKAGKPLPLPVDVTERVDEAGQRWMVADLALAPLGAGDYAIELSATIADTTQQAITAIRVTR